MASVRVFGSPTSAELARVLTCLFEKEVEFQLIRVEYFKGLEKRPEYLKLQPNGQALTYEEGLLTLVVPLLPERPPPRHVRAGVRLHVLVEEEGEQVVGGDIGPRLVAERRRGDAEGARESTTRRC